MRLLFRLIRNVLVNVLYALRWPFVVSRRGFTDFVRIELDGPLPLRHEPRGVPFFLRRFFAPGPSETEESLQRVLDAVAADPHVRGVLLLVRSPSMGMGQAATLRARFDALRAAGKELAVWLADGRTGAYYLASAGTYVALAPGGSLDLTGLAAEVRFYGGLLAKLPVRAEVIARGRYKNALDPFAREHMTPEHREAMDALLDDYAALVRGGIARGRGLEEGSVAALIDDGPYGADRALGAKLVDALHYEDELEEKLGRDGKKARFVDGKVYLARAKRWDWRPLLRRPCIAYVPVRGSIHGGESRGIAGGSQSAGDRTVCAALEAARKDKRARAILLHVDSRGGSSLASDLMWRAVKRAAAEKPVVALMGDYAASGGYYVACAAHEIIASPGTLTGSIGVIAAKLDASGLLARLGIHTETLRRGARADLYSASRALTEAEHARLAADIDAIYEQFLARVAEGRKLSRDDVHAVAEGRVHTGQRALALRLVDGLGHLHVAKARAAARAGFSARADVPLVPYGSPPRPHLGLGRLLGMFSTWVFAPANWPREGPEETNASPAEGSSFPDVHAIAADLTELASMAESRILAYTPIHIHLG